MPRMVSWRSMGPSNMLNISVAAVFFGCALCNDVVPGPAEFGNSLGEVIDPENAGCVIGLDGFVSLEVFEEAFIFFLFYGG